MTKAGIKRLWKKHPLKISIIISILFHLLTLFIYAEWLSVLNWIPAGDFAKAADEPLAFELVENPNAQPTDKPVTPTNLLSDRNSEARDNIEERLPESFVPYNEGIPEGALQMRALPGTPALPPPQPEQEETEETEKEKEEEEKQKDDGTLALHERYSEPVTSNTKKFSKSLLTKNTQGQPGDITSRTLNYDNRKFSAKKLGDFTLNTYSWDFAPYLLELKRRIQRNIFPPPAFTMMGAIDGQFILRFNILPNGTLEVLEVLDSQGHPSLELTSKKAVELSAPFPPLPENFPEEKLIITGRFVYAVHKEDPLQSRRNEAMQQRWRRRRR